MSKNPYKFINLPSSDEQIQLLIRNQRIMKYYVNKNQNEYRYLIFQYQKAIKELRIFINDLVGVNKLSEASAISTIVFEGYVSYNKNFQIYCGDSRVLDLGGYEGIDILDGLGCCRHIASFSADTFKKDFTMIPCHINGVKRTLSSAMLDELKKCNLTPNDIADHVCLLFSYYSRYYIFDCSNINIYYIDNLTAKSITDQSTMQLYFEDLISDSFYSNRRMNKLVAKINSYKGNIQGQKVVGKCIEAQEIILNNPSQCVDFHNNIKSELQEVHEQKKLIIKRFR